MQENNKNWILCLGAGIGCGFGVGWGFGGLLLSSFLLTVLLFLYQQKQFSLSTNQRVQLRNREICVVY